MNCSKGLRWLTFPTLLLLALLMTGCCCWQLTPGETEQATPTARTGEQPGLATPTPTPTPLAGGPGSDETPAPPTSRCQGLSGDLEMQVLVGPADAVGLEPLAVGSIPFSVASDQPPYVVEGGGPISYAEVLVKEWGTYEVTMDMETTVEGTCGGEPGEESLELVVEMTGEQMVTVDAEGFHGEYPWSGSHTRNLTFPLADGASVEGEGWTFVLHLPAE